MLKLPKCKTEFYQEKFHRSSMRKLEKQFFRESRRLLDDVDKVEALYSVLHERGSESEEFWQGLHAFSIVRKQMRGFGIVSFAKIVQKIYDFE